MIEFANRKITPSDIDLINRRIIELQKEGRNIVKLNIGNLDTDRPIKINEITDEEFDGSNHYTNIKGDAELRKLIVDKIQKTSGVVYDVEKEITMVSGTRSGIYHVFNAILNQGDEVIIPRGTWVTYFNMLENFNAVAVVADTKPENNYKLTPEILEKFITNKTKAVVITNPGNPTGAIYTKNELNELLKIIEKHPQMIIMSDEIYTDIHYTDERVCSVVEATNNPETRKQIVVFNGFSKNLSMAGDRIAYVLTHNQELISRVYGSQALINSCVNNIAQLLAKKMMKKDLSGYFETLLNRLKKNRDFVCDYINKIDGLSAIKPDGALYVMVDYSKLEEKYKNNKNYESDRSVCEYLLQNGVATTPGSSFALNNSFRICFACSFEELERGIKLIEKALI
ncbi:MAG: pyridoxal phosphate-dependent aminotransferase [Rickettsiales bacterium]|nr:pyridoxal phosphate-dependent aminotransferase [Rickettsiales bacterium]